MSVPWCNRPCRRRRLRRCDSIGGARQFVGNRLRRDVPSRMARSLPSPRPPGRLPTAVRATTQVASNAMPIHRKGPALVVSRALRRPDVGVPSRFVVRDWGVSTDPRWLEGPTEAADTPCRFVRCETSSIGRHRPSREASPGVYGAVGYTRRLPAPSEVLPAVCGRNPERAEDDLVNFFHSSAAKGWLQQDPDLERRLTKKGIKEDSQLTCSSLCAMGAPIFSRFDLMSRRGSSSTRASMGMRRFGALPWRRQFRARRNRKSERGPIGHQPQ
jgi:hypothetical protein